MQQMMKKKVKMEEWVSNFLNHILYSPSYVLIESWTARMDSETSSVSELIAYGCKYLHKTQNY